MIVRRKLTDKQAEQIAELYKENKLLVKEIAERFGVHRKTVRNTANYFGVFKTREESKRRRNLYHEVFEDIDSEEKAYWLGFISADGSINNRHLKIALAETDEDHLVK